MSEQDIREKVIKELAWAIEDEDVLDALYVDDLEDVIETMKNALALLKAQKPCEDAVSRKDVINVLQSPCDMRYINGNWHPCIGDYIEAITNLSAVAPKAQEPVEYVVHCKNADLSNGTKFACGECCGSLLHKKVNYCPWCGRAVKWE